MRPCKKSLEFTIVSTIAVLPYDRVNEAAQQDIQKIFNLTNNHIDSIDAEIKQATLKSMSRTGSAVTLAKKIANQYIKIVTHTVSIP